ncbi:hypothetical protein [Fundidesulfovibrio soli]|uniref:hypothetical protein n=1 Tax=Fundidesulfovibrio soli TaxID=2922716 RepID=UPI001FAF8E0D|nr:hypothetical protein [Fundidesulfovibrio soli]
MNAVLPESRPGKAGLPGILCFAAGAAAYFPASGWAAFGLPGLYVLTTALLLAAVFLRGAGGATPPAGLLLARSAQGLLCALAGAGAAYNLIAYANIDFTRCLDTVNSGAQVVRVWMVAHGQSLYPPIGESQLLLSIYPPLYFYLAGALCALGANPYHAALAVNGASLAGILATILLWTRRESGSWLVAGLMALAFFCQPSLSGCVRWIRSDLFAWALAFWGAYLFFTGRGGRGQAALAGLLLALSLFSKQQTLSLLTGCVSFFLVRPGWFGRCLVLGLSAGAAGAAMFGALMLATHGSYLTHSFLYPAAMSAQPSVSSWANALPRIRTFGLRAAGLLLAFAAALGRDARLRRVSPVAWLALVQTAMLLLLLKHWGAGENYYWALLGLLCVLAGGLAGRWMDCLPKGSPLAWALLAAVFMGAPGLAAIEFNLSLPRESNPAVDGINAFIEKGGYQRVLLNTEAGCAVLGKPWQPRVTFFDSLELFFYEKAKLWKFHDSQLARDITARKYDAVIAGGTAMAPQFWWYVANGYEKAGQAGYSTFHTPLPGAIVLYPKPSNDPVSSGGVSARVSGVEGVYALADFGAYAFTKHETAKAGTVTFSLESDGPVNGIRVAFASLVIHPGEGHSLDVEVSEDGGPFRQIFSYTGDAKNDADKELLEARHEASFETSSRRTAVRFVLRGSGQLWFSEQFPLSFIVR